MRKRVKCESVSNEKYIKGQSEITRESVFYEKVCSMRKCVKWESVLNESARMRNCTNENAYNSENVMEICTRLRKYATMKKCFHWESVLNEKVF